MQSPIVYNCLCYRYKLKVKVEGKIITLLSTMAETIIKNSLHKLHVDTENHARVHW